MPDHARASTPATSAASFPPRRRPTASRSTAVFDDFQRAHRARHDALESPGLDGLLPRQQQSCRRYSARCSPPTMGAQCMSWATSPAATELEQIGDGLGAADDGAARRRSPGSFRTPASTATLVALLTAREQATGHARGHARTRGAGSAAHRLRLARGALVGGQGGEACRLRAPDHLRRIPTDAVVRARSRTSWSAAIAADRAAGRRPACVVASIGTTSSTAVDPVAADRRDLPAARRLAARGCRLSRARRRSCPELRAHVRGRGRRPTASCSIPTSGC